MSKSVKNIEITFENIDYIIIPSHYFLNFVLEDVNTVVCRAAINAILRYFVAKSIMFVLRKDVNDIASSLEGDVHDVHYGNEKLFERIHIYHDITNIKMIYTDDTTEEFSVGWEDEDNNEYRNSLQTTSINEDGNLYVRIKEKKSPKEDGVNAEQ